MTRALKKRRALRRLELPRGRVGLKRFLERSRKAAEKAGFTEEEINRLIHSFRKIAKD
jgi:RimJ/RimL family protein N-acetyltransferase